MACSETGGFKPPPREHLAGEGRGGGSNGEAVREGFWLQAYSLLYLQTFPSLFIAFFNKKL